MGLILDISPRTLEKVLYFASYIVLDARIQDFSISRCYLRRNTAKRLTNTVTAHSA